MIFFSQKLHSPSIQESAMTGSIRKEIGTRDVFVPKPD
jgi:hypothetical protein